VILDGEVRIDALLPDEMAAKAEQFGIKKAEMSAGSLFVLAVLAGAFIALGAIFATTVVAGAADKLPFGVTRLLAGLVFTLGLVLVMVGGAELFTGNALIVMAWASHKVSTRSLLRNWGIAYFGNFAGALATAAVMFASAQYTFGKGVIGAAALSIADGTTSCGGCNSTR
jgi:formate transporter